MIYHFFFFIKVSKSIYAKSKMQVCSSDPRFLSSPVPSICSERVTRCPRIDAGDDGAADVMPDAEDCSGNGG